MWTCFMVRSCWSSSRGPQRVWTLSLAGSLSSEHWRPSESPDINLPLVFHVFQVILFCPAVKFWHRGFLKPYFPSHLLHFVYVASRIISGALKKYRKKDLHMRDTNQCQSKPFAQVGRRKNQQTAGPLWFALSDVPDAESPPAIQPDW